MEVNEPMPTMQGLRLNFLEVVFNKHKVFLRKAAYSDELFKEYKRHSDFFIYKRSDSSYLWELCSTKESLSDIFEEVEIAIEEHAPIFAKIVERAIVELFTRRGYKVFKQPNSSIWEVELRKSEKPKQFGALVLHPTLVFSVRNLYSQLERRQIIGLSVRRRMKPIFTGSEDSITSQLTNTHGLRRNYEGKIVASTHVVNRYLEATKQQQSYNNYRKEAGAAHIEFEHFRTYTEYFNKIASKFYLPDGLKIQNFSPVNLPSASFESISIPKPQYFYYNERIDPLSYNAKAISKLRPYSFERFTNRQLRILVVSPDKYENSIGKYMVTLKAKLSQLFHLNNVEFYLQTMKPSETYLDAINKIDAHDYNLAIILLSQQDKEIDTPRSPYYLTKAKLLNQRLITQDLTIEVLRKNEDVIDNDIALNVYSKLGGIAWTIEKSEKNVSELIIGIGSTIDDSGEWIIGFANIFDYNGTYLVGDCSQLSTMNEYAKDLERYLIDTLTLAFRKKGLSDGDSVRLIFHLFKAPSRKYELKAINDALKHFGTYDIEYGLVHLSYNHNFKIFKNQGRETPGRGRFVPLSHRQALLHVGDSSAVPIQIWLDKRSTYKDIYEITKQVLYFSHLSYRSFIPPNTPVTIKYPNLMARMVSELKKIPSWDPSILDRLNDKPWFI